METLLWMSRVVFAFTSYVDIEHTFYSIHKEGAKEANPVLAILGHKHAWKVATVASLAFFVYAWTDWPMLLIGSGVHMVAALASGAARRWL